MNLTTDSTVLVIGAGIMGGGIAQVAAQAGHRVLLYDARSGAAAEVKVKVSETLTKLVEKGKLDVDAAAVVLEALEPIEKLSQASSAALAIEAIVESLSAKRELLRTLEATLSSTCVLASNTSSFSITALANGLTHPERVVGMHFFNPAALMKLVEIVSGLQTDAAVAQAVFELARAWGKSPVHARSTPGFIVNRIARPFYAETLSLLQERAAEPRVLDACLRAAGFRMGPCELMDLIGHDTNFAVTESVYAANFGDKRYVPSRIQRELVEGGLLGRKAGRGFFEYKKHTNEPTAQSPAHGQVAEPAVPLPAAQRVVLHGKSGMLERWAMQLHSAGRAYSRAPHSDWTGLEIDAAQLRLTDGRPAAQIAASERIVDVAVFDATGILHPGAAHGAPLALSIATCATPRFQADAPQWLTAAGFLAERIADTAGLVVARTLAMLINEAADAVQQGVCTQDAADLAMKLGVNYPAGPFEWLARWHARSVVQLLDQLAVHYRSERYRVSPWLLQQAWAHAALQPKMSSA